jgi:hypothetical protein
LPPPIEALAAIESIFSLNAPDRCSGRLDHRTDTRAMYRGMALLLGLIALVDVYVYDSRHVNAAIEIWNRISLYFGI